MRSVCVIRRSQAWREFRLRPGDFYVERAAAMWQTAFGSSYESFRRSLHEIQKENFARVGFDVVCDLDDYQQHLNEETVLFPTDDDDWYHPDLLGVVMPQAANFRWCNWPHVVYALNRLEARAEVCATNSYCLRSPVDAGLVDNHERARRRLKDSEDGLLLEECLSLYNWSLASLSFLKKVASAEQLRAHYRECLRPLSRPSPDVFDPHLRRMAELYSSLRPRRMFI